MSIVDANPAAVAPFERRRRQLRYASLGVIAAAVLGLGWMAPQFGNPTAAAAPAPRSPLATVRVAMAEETTLAPLSWVPGNVHSRFDARIASEIAGQAQNIVAVGTRVKRGDILASIDDAALKLVAQEQLARLARLQIEHDQAQRQRSRYRALAAGNTVSGLQLDEIEGRYNVLGAQIREARASLQQIELQIGRSQVRAPFSGIVAERFAAPGERIASGAPLLRLVDTNALEIRARAPVALALELSTDSAAKLRVAGGERPIALGSIVPVGDEVSRQIELRLPLTDSALSIGSAVEIGVPATRARVALTVPRDALLLRPEGSFVVRIDAKSQAQRVAVQSGERIGEQVEVRGELNAGDRVAVRGAERLSNGQSVQVLNNNETPVRQVTASVGTSR